MSEEKRIEKSLDLHSEPVQEILGRPPGWLVRSGITVIVVVIAILLIGSQFVKYPEVLTAEITINADHLPAQIKARSSGRIDTVFVDDNQKVTQGTPLALIENAANYEDVYFLKSSLSKLDRDSLWLCVYDLRLGEIQNFYAQYVQSSNDLHFFETMGFQDELIASKKKQLWVLRQTLKSQEDKVKLSLKQLTVAHNKFSVDSILYLNNALSKVSYEDAKSTFLQQQLSRQSLLVELDNTKLNIVQTEQTIIELEQSRLEQADELKMQLIISRDQLETQITEWEKEYLLESPSNGVVAFSKYWQRNQNINEGETVVTIIPCEGSTYYGKIYLSQQGAGKVKSGQNVNIKLDDYPYMEYGFVQVPLSGISLMPFDDSNGQNVFVMEVKLPDSLITQYGVQIPYRPEMKGTAEIITEDLTVLDRLINPIKAVIKR